MKTPSLKPYTALKIIKYPYLVANWSKKADREAKSMDAWLIKTGFTFLLLHNFPVMILPRDEARPIKINRRDVFAFFGIVFSV